MHGSPQPPQQSHAAKLASPTALLAEYAELKGEQRDCIARRNTLIYSALGAAGAIGYAAITRHLPQLLLMVPFACFALGWTYLRDDLKSKAIRWYIGRSLAPRLARLTDDADALAWEYEDTSDGLRNQRRWIQLIVDLAVFAFPGYAAVTMLAGPSARYSSSYGFWTYALIVAAIASSTLLTVQFMRYSEAETRLPRLRRKNRVNP